MRRLFPDYHAVEMQSYKRTRVFPIMHLVAMRRDTYEQHPVHRQEPFQAMNDAKNIALKKMRDLGTLRYMLPGMAAEIDEIDEVFDGDPWPYGIEPNRPTLEALVRYLAEQVDDQGAHSAGRTVRANLRRIIQGGSSHQRRRSSPAVNRYGAMTDEARKLCGRTARAALGWWSATASSP